MKPRNFMLVILALLVVALLGSSGTAEAQSSSSFVLQRFVTVAGGSATSASFAVTSVVGQPSADIVAGPSFRVSGGFLFPREQATFSIGGTVSGLAGIGLVLQNNGAGDLPVAANGPFTFATMLVSGTTYAVTVRTQPANPAQVCTVTNGAGTLAGSNITNISVVCTTVAPPSVFLPFVDK